MPPHVTDKKNWTRDRCVRRKPMRDACAGKASSRRWAHNRSEAAISRPILNIFQSNNYSKCDLVLRTNWLELRFHARDLRRLLLPCVAFDHRRWCMQRCLRLQLATHTDASAKFWPKYLGKGRAERPPEDFIPRSSAFSFWHVSKGPLTLTRLQEKSPSAQKNIW
jgi:hypothetical protein